MTLDKIYNTDCIEYMRTMDNNSVDLTLTDIPYNAVHQTITGRDRHFKKLGNIDKGKADLLQFDIDTFLQSVYRVTKSTIIVFCGKEQLSHIFAFFFEHQSKKHGTVRQLIWEKTNPAPLNGQYNYLSGIENAVWFKKRGGVFNACFKNTVFTCPQGSSKRHPTEKNHKLLQTLILENSNKGDIVFDPCAGSGSHCLVAKENDRHFIGCEIDKEYAQIAIDRVS